ncbi:type II toxin-antitoxin system RelE/ParE family toxin [Loigolactobacillus zhaoyuanensis]|uniref:type II toxin-antitoxin system YoeB family toxin n=1 Tax=Loigolactobacillus zhaoyuanensis TaxID=2486017 RepID=UPI000F73709A|nr:type II toxin-antitoxin system YoeB family toxin [Loigolactobacillus zhaoyuanensis]
MGNFKVLEHHSITKQRTKLAQAQLLNIYEHILDQLADNPFTQNYQMELLEPRNKRPKTYSMRINNQHRVVYTVDKATKTVRVWSAWTHYEKTVKQLKQ